jgi:uncharacterized protein DUF6879
MARRTITQIPSPEWITLLSGFTRSAFRLETLQHYTAPDEAEALDRFRAGKDPQIDLSWWTELAKGHTAAGRQMSRVRVIIEPTSEYTRFALLAYPVMTAAGDDIRIIAVPSGSWPDGVPHQDFWLFDDEVWVMAYDDRGAFLGAEQLDDRQAVDEHLRWRQPKASPKNRYQTTRNGNRN